MRARSREDLVAAGLSEEKAEGITNRKQMRNYRLLTQKKAGHRTGTTSHFTAWKAEGAVKSALQKTSTGKLADALSGRTAAAFALLYVSGFKNVWAVSQASADQLLAVRGIGLVSLGFIEEYLKEQSVNLQWTARS